MIEHCDRVGKKILISGGGPAQISPVSASLRKEFSLIANPHFCKSALARYTQWDFISLVERHGIAYHEKELGQLFCDQSAKLIVKMLTDECRPAGVRISTDCNVSGVERGANGFVLTTHRGSIETSSLVIACGGLSVPKMGATSFGYKLAQKFGHQVVPTRAGLVPLTFTQMIWFDQGFIGRQLAGSGQCGRQIFQRDAVYPSRHQQTPAILRRFRAPGLERATLVNLLPLTDADTWLKTAIVASGCRIENRARQFLPEAVGAALVREVELGSRRCANIRRATCERSAAVAELALPSRWHGRISHCRGDCRRCRYR